MVGLPALSGVGGLVDVLSIRGLCLCGREKGVADRAADAEEVGGEGVLPSGEKVRVHGAEHFHCWGVGLEFPCWGRVLCGIHGSGPSRGCSGRLCDGRWGRVCCQGLGDSSFDLGSEGALEVLEGGGQGDKAVLEQGHANVPRYR